MTYQQAYDKIIDAYFKDEIQPFEPKFCFCGTLCNNTSRWFYGNDEENPANRNIRFTDSGYLGLELFVMEEALLKGIHEFLNTGCEEVYANEFHDEEGQTLDVDEHEKFEETLFAGMSAALDVLKEIHRSRGEDVDQISKPFTKRQLV